MIATLFKEYRPSLFFNIVAALFLIIGFVLGIPVFVDYFKTGLVERFPSLIVACFSLTIALLLWITGMILQVIVKKEKQRYELFLNELMQNREK